MKKYFSLILLFIALSGLNAQIQMQATSKHDLKIIQETWDKEGIKSFQKLENLYPIYKINGKQIISLIAKVNSNYNVSNLQQYEISQGSRIGNIVTLKVPLSAIQQISSIPGISYLEIAAKVQPHLNRALKDARVDSVHLGINLPQAYTGKNVYIGVTDWGFDYTHPMYYDTTLSFTRIAAAWDQYKQSGPNPTGFNYGTEYTSQADLFAAGSDTANIYSYSYHGGHVAGIAGGSGAGTAYRGVAYEAEFLFTTFLVDAGAVIDAYDWMHQKAVAANKRLVINQSWGLHYIGNLDGTSLISQAIDNLSDQGVVFASSGGNNGDVNFHLKKTFNNDVLKSKVDFYSYSANPNMWGQSITLWGEPTKNFSVGVSVTNASNVILNESIFYNSATTTNYIDTFLVIGTDTVFYNLSMENANPLNNRPHARFRIKNTNTAYRIILNVSATDGTVHAWNVTELTNGVGNWGMPFSLGGAGTTFGDANYGIGEPSCTESVISVAAHSSRYALPSGTLTGGAIASFSSYGPTLDERSKPDISAPGVSVCSAVSSFTDNSFTSAQIVSFNGTDYKFTRISGTSMSSPMVTGVVALILEANPYLMPWQVKDIIRQSARTDSYTGVIPAGGSLRWGMGKLDAYEAIKLALNTVSIDQIDEKSFVKVFPNPTTGLLYIQGNLKGNETIQLIGLDGKILLSGQLEIGKLDLTDFEPGMYILKIHSNSGDKSVQVIKE